MTSEQKKSLLLLNSVIFNYHGFDEEEQKILEKIASEENALEELNWVNEFLNKDLSNLFERSREYFRGTIALYDKETKLNYLKKVWTATHKKGHITEMEAMAILKLAKDWSVQRDFLNEVRQ